MPSRGRSRLRGIACGAFLLAFCDNAPNREIDQAEAAAAEWACKKRAHSSGGATIRVVAGG